MYSDELTLEHWCESVRICIYYPFEAYSVKMVQGMRYFWPQTRYNKFLYDIRDFQEDWTHLKLRILDPHCDITIISNKEQAIKFSDYIYNINRNDFALKSLIAKKIYEATL